MTNSTNTKKALLVSALSLLVCFSLLVGTTYAWFTDSVTSANNIIKTGNLDVAMYWAQGTEDPDSANWTDASAGAIFNYNKWEPGYVEVRHIKIENKGSLALKYKVNIVANGEVSDLANVIDVYYVDPAVQVAERDDLANVSKLGTLTEVLAGLGESGNGTLEAGNSDIITIALCMREQVGNEHQNKSIGTDFSIQLFATQHTSENDGFGNDYDEDAAISVTTTEQLVNAIENGENVVLENNISIAEVVTVDGDIKIDLNGNKLDASGMTGENIGRPFHLTEGASLTIDAEGAEIVLGGYGLVNVPADVKNADMTVIY